MASRSTIVAVSAIGLFIIIAAGIVLFANSRKNTTTNSTVSNSSISVTTGSFKDGTYTASGSYNTPESVESIDVTITLKNNLISSVSTSTNAKDRESKQYLNLFKQGISSVVNSKTLDKATVSGSVNGSSLTGSGFNEALKKIADQARN
ncbi:MAG: hypothetical protein WCK98_02555 [bacterium]